MPGQVDERIYSCTVGLLILSATLLGLLFLLLVNTALIGLGSNACLCLSSMGLYVLVIILLGTSGMIAFVNIEHDMVLFFTFLGIIVDTGATVFMISTFINSPHGIKNITVYSGLAFVSAFSAAVLLSAALIYLIKLRYEIQCNDESLEDDRI